jgi:hypothetical protein
MQGSPASGRVVFQGRSGGLLGIANPSIVAIVSVIGGRGRPALY